MPIIFPKKGWPRPVFRRWKSIRFVFIILRIFGPLPGLPALAWAAVPQAHALRTVRHLAKNTFTHNWTNWAGFSDFWGIILDIKVYTGRFIRTFHAKWSFFSWNLVLKALFHGLKLGNYRFSSEDGGAVFWGTYTFTCQSTVKVLCCCSCVFQPRRGWGPAPSCCTYTIIIESFPLCIVYSVLTVWFPLSIVYSPYGFHCP